VPSLARRSEDLPRGIAAGDVRLLSDSCHRSAPTARTENRRSRRSRTATGTSIPCHPKQPIAAGFEAARASGASDTDSSPTPCCLVSTHDPLAADRRPIVRGCSRPPPHLRHQAAPQLHPTVTAAGRDISHPDRSYGASCRSTGFATVQHSEDGSPAKRRPPQGGRTRRDGTIDGRLLLICGSSLNDRSCRGRCQVRVA
jgi:hypothetical protein